MMLKVIINFKNQITYTYKSLSVKTRKETTRFLVAFVIAWFAKTIINEFPFFTQILLIPNLDGLIQNTLIYLTQFFLEALGHEVYSNGIFIQIKDTVGIRYELGCLAFRHMTLFIVFILTYFGKLIHKLWYIPLGIFVIILINSIRGTMICLAQLHYPNNSIAIHDIISPIFMYITILFLWLIWVAKFGAYKKN